MTHFLALYGSCFMILTLFVGIAVFLESFLP